MRQTLGFASAFPKVSTLSLVQNAYTPHTLVSVACFLLCSDMVTSFDIVSFSPFKCAGLNTWSARQIVCHTCQAPEHPCEGSYQNILKAWLCLKRCKLRACASLLAVQPRRQSDQLQPAHSTQQQW